MTQIIKSRVFRNQLFSLISVLVFASLVSMLLFYATTKSLRDEITTNSSLSVTQMQRSIDSSLNVIQNLAQSLSVNSEIISSCTLTGREYGSIAINNGIIRKLLYEQRSIDPLIDEICTIYFDQDTIITSGYSYFGDLVDPVSERTFGMDYDALLSFLKEQNYLGTFLTEASSDASPQIFSAYPIFNPINYKPGGVILVILNTDSLLNANIQPSVIDDNYMIYSALTDVLFSTDVKYDQLIRDNLSDHVTTKSIRYESGDYILSSIPSSVSALEYYILLDNSRFFGKLQQLILGTLLVNAAAFFIGVVISLFWARHNYTPIKDIASVLDSGKAENGDEFQQIRTSIHSLLVRQEDNEKNLASNAELIGSYLLVNLLNGNIENSERFRNANQKYHLGITGNSFFICLISMPSLHNKTASSSSERAEQMKLVLTSGIHNAFPQNHPVPILDNTHDLVLLFNLDGDEHQPVSLAYDILAHFSQFATDYSKALDTELCFIITREYQGIDGISSAYEEAEELLDYAYMSGAWNVPVTAEYRHKNDHPNDGENNYIDYLKAERNILNCIIVEQYAEAAAYLGDVFEKYASGSTQDQYIQGHVLKTVQAYLLDISSIFPHEFAVSLNLKKGMNPSLSVDERYRITISNLQDMAAFIHENQSIENNAAKDILAFIDTNYSDPNLNRDMIAEHLGLSISSVSHVIKKSTGKTLTELINERRVAKACELLKTTPLTLQQVAEQVGYTNTWTFSRIIKNVTGVSPGKIRDTM